LQAKKRSKEKALGWTGLRKFHRKEERKRKGFVVA